jgi:hypothetical protein
MPEKRPSISSASKTPRRAWKIYTLDVTVDLITCKFTSQNVTIRHIPSIIQYCGVIILKINKESFQ